VNSHTLLIFSRFAAFIAIGSLMARDISETVDLTGRILLWGSIPMLVASASKAIAELAMGFTLHAMLTGAAEPSGTDASITLLDGIHFSASLAELVILLPLIVVWLIFLNAAMRALLRAGVSGLTHSAKSVVWWWFVPVLNIYFAPQIVGQVWRASLRPETWKSTLFKPIVALWWLLYVAATAGDRILTNIRDLDSIEGLQKYYLLSALFTIIGIAAIPLFMAIVQNIRKGQRALSASEAASQE
jgi:Domain of unknown function (DUF4328)